MVKMKRGLLLTTLLMLMAGCSSEDVTPRKVDTINELSPRTIALEQTETINEKEMIESNQEIKNLNSVNNDSVETHSPLIASSETPSLSLESSGPEETLAEDSIIIGDSKFINLMHEEKFQDWINVADKYGAKLYAVPYSDVFAIVKNQEVLVGMSTGVASAAPNYIDILCYLMVDKGESAEKIIEGIKHVAQTGESVQIVGPQEFGDDFSIVKQDERIVVSW